MTQKKKRLVRWFSVAGATLIVLLLWSLWGNVALTLTTYQVETDDLPEAFDGFKIAQVSDLHNATFGKDNKKFLAMLREAAPDLIAMTGDLVDCRRTDIDVALAFAQEAAKIAPCYYVVGNHEAWISEDQRDQLETGLTESGVVVLRGEKTSWEKEDAVISILGIDDPDFAMLPEMEVRDIDDLEPSEGFTLLLSHRPERFDEYVSTDVDLVLTGHAHGGQFRLPFVGGLYAPNQGLFPAYDTGVFTEDNTTMVVSRGLGNSAFPLRLNNRPEVVLVVLSAT